MQGTIAGRAGYNQHAALAVAGCTRNNQHAALGVVNAATQTLATATKFHEYEALLGGAYCFTHGWTSDVDHHSGTCTHRAPDHKPLATLACRMGGKLFLKGA